MKIIFSLEYPNACKPQELSEEVTNFLIKDTNGNVLEVFQDIWKISKGVASMFFAPNEHKDGQFWYLLQTLESGYGYIGSQTYMQNNVLSIEGTSMNIE